ncbi:MAG TPA: hypothetical protein VGG78_04755 [Gemmatimonadaceae bacterium]
MQTPPQSATLPIVPRFALAVLLALAVGCASSTGAGAAGPGSAVPDTGDRSYIGDAQLAASSETAYEIVQRLRPEYLRPDPVVRNAVTTHIDPVLVVNGRQTGSVDDLRRMPASSLTRIRYYGPEEAKRRFGMQFTAAALELTYRQR